MTRGGALDPAELERTLAAMQRHRWQIVLNYPRNKKPAAPKGQPWPITADPERVASHVRGGGNIGLLCHESTGVAVLDPDALGPWADLIGLLGQPSDPWVLTGSGRLHYYIAWVPDLPAKLTWCGVVIGEIMRGPGQQQTILPPSVHPITGSRYRWITELVNPAEAPLPRLATDWLIFLRHRVYAQAHRLA